MKPFFGDRKREMALTAKVIPELERTTGVGIGALCENLVRGNFTYREITETIRLALIGGGTSPEEAANLVNTYVPIRPLGDAHILAADILTFLWTGSDAEQTVNHGND